MEPKELLQNNIEKKLEELNKMQVGTEDHHRATEDLNKMYRLYIDEYDSEIAAAEKSAKLDLEARKIEEETKRKEAELEVRLKESEIENRKSKRDLLGTALKGLVIVGGTVVVCLVDMSDHILPRDKLKFIDKAKL